MLQQPDPLPTAHCPRPCPPGCALWSELGFEKFFGASADSPPAAVASLAGLWLAGWPGAPEAAGRWWWWWCLSRAGAGGPGMGMGRGADGRVGVRRLGVPFVGRGCGQVTGFRLRHVNGQVRRRHVVPI